MSVLEMTSETESSMSSPETITSETLVQSKSSFLFKKSTAMWRSRISWRIATAVFLTIMAVQATILAFTLGSYEKTRLNELKRLARTALLPVVYSDPDDYLKSPLTPEQEFRILNHSIITGMSIYSQDYNLLDVGGNPVITQIRDESDIGQTFLSESGNSYEAILGPSDLSIPYYIVVKLDSRTVMDEVAYYVEQSIKVMLLLSAFVTAVLMIALGKWLLEPILFLRSNLEQASTNPETPNIIRSPYDPRDEIGGAISIAQDLIKQNAKNMRAIKNAAQSQIHKLAYYDTLTSLPNRTLFVQKLSEYVKSPSDDADAKIKRVAVVTLDLDHFKDVNDSMGHNVGDSILRAVGKRLQSSLPETAVVARTGEDEFSIMYPLLDEHETQRSFGETVQTIIRTEPFKIFNENFQIRSSIGISVFPDDAVDPDQVMKNADIALNRAKEDGRDCIREYLEDFDKAVQARFLLLRDLRDALEKKQLSLHYQPQLDLKTGKIIGAEALLRWFKPDDSKDGGRFISPAEFIPVAEQSGLIVPIGAWVLRHACETAKRWQNEGHEIRIAVNVSGVQFQQSDLVGLTKSVLEETGVNPNLLELEVTESAFMEDIQHTVQTLKELHSLGVELAIDDFGTGYSSLSYLRQFPIDRLKIDQSFIRNALTNNDDRAIARTIIGLGRSLNLRVIAEGVETQEHEEFLLSEGCDEVQGYRYSRPVPDEKFFEFVNGYNGDFSFFNK
ncbi:MAG: bifunctional diguanylate cyclase/phosphodiesterase [Micavibrio aeruginosavorus]|uniref:Bifunctional diguanylate cyclase/phosphodiesterase n=1 Tax=Micavibrio aeruginosavorus TaxID=349221 RepID=A0A2W5FRI3_9BACT|nr:MAG: bifunctional diguanylate cyclase/phosphodiesterase [Micavibrio aeruginosavorus]